MSLKFTGHETFVVRSFWPKKGFDFVSNGGSFNDDNSVVDLGVGKNMVSSIHFWMKALGLIHTEELTTTTIANELFGENGYDPLLEDIGTIWLLHYNLVKANFASIYNLVFNEFRKERSIFSKDHLSSFIRRKYSELEENSFNPKSIDKDISVFTRLYRKLNYSTISKNFEDEISSLMLELELLPSSIEETLQEGTQKIEKNRVVLSSGKTENKFTY